MPTGNFAISGTRMGDKQPSKTGKQGGKQPSRRWLAVTVTKRSFYEESQEPGLYDELIK